MIIGMGELGDGYRALCRVGGQPCLLEGIESDAALLRWQPGFPGAAEPAASDLGLIGEQHSGPVRSPLDRVERVVAFEQLDSAPEWSRFPAPAAHGEVLEPACRGDALLALTAAVRRAVPENGGEIVLEVRALGTHVEIAGRVESGSGTTHWIPPREVPELVRALRECTYTPEQGAWTSLHYRLRDGEDPRTEFEHAEPVFDAVRTDTARPTGHHFDELRFLPRRSAPPWLLDGARAYHVRDRSEEASDVVTARPVRMARVFDGAGEAGPRVFRPVVPRAEAEDVLRYLLGAHTVLQARSASLDEVDPGRGEQVPKAYLTDGAWVWPAAVAYYLGEHGVAPQRELLDHIRRRGYEPPEVLATRAEDEAKALVLGTDVETMSGAHRQQALSELRTAIASHGISRRFYSFDAPLEGGWSMLCGSDGWWTVAHRAAVPENAEAARRAAIEDEAGVPGGVVTERQSFPDLVAAGTHLLGCLLRDWAAYQRVPGEPLEDHECPWGVLTGGDLADFEGKFLDDLAADAEIDCFGPQESNVAFVAGTTLPQRGVPPRTEPGTYRRYRVRSPFAAVIGTARAGEGATGGGTAYVLPRSLGELVAGNWLLEA